MARFKPAGKKKPETRPKVAAVPCLVLLALAMISVFVVLYYALKAG